MTENQIINLGFTEINQIKTFTNNVLEDGEVIKALA